jgi:hypothetical protein
MVLIRSLAFQGAEWEMYSKRIAAEATALGGADFAVLFAKASLAGNFYDCVNRELDCPLIGGTSFRGVLASDVGESGGLHEAGLFLIRDEDGEYGVGVAELGEDPFEAARRALYNALEHAGCTGELPTLIWIYQAPGNEERVLEGIQSIVGDNCPIVGGSSADCELTGEWLQFSNEGVYKDSVVVGVLFPSGGVGLAFGSGYASTGQSCVISTSGPRCIKTMNGRPAAEVYNEWIGGALDEEIVSGGNVLHMTAMHPLGIEIGDVNGKKQFALVHPSSVSTDGCLETFANIPDGATVNAMLGSKEALKKRLGRVAQEAKEYIDIDGREVAGALAVYCGGYMPALNGEFGSVAESMSKALPDVPYLATFSYGEQGLMAGKNIHGNLMISTVLFGR